MKRIVASIVIVALAVVLIWMAGTALGFEVGLASSLAISIVLTLVLNLGAAAFRSGKMRNSH